MTVPSENKKSDTSDNPAIKESKPAIKKVGLNLITILLLVFFFPVGIYLMYRKTNWPIRRKHIITGVWAVLVVLMTIAVINAPPVITMNNLDEREDTTTEDETYKISGRISPVDALLTIDNEVVETNARGEFTYLYELEEGRNEVVVEVKDSNDKVNVKTYYIYRYTAKEIAERIAREEAERKAQEAEEEKRQREEEKRREAEREEQRAEEEREAEARAEEERKAEEEKRQREEEKRREAEREAALNAPKTSFGNGTFLVGKDIEAGRYRTPNNSGTCYYERLSGLSGTLNDIIANGLPSGQAIVDIRSSDVAFKSQNCGTWKKI